MRRRIKWITLGLCAILVLAGIFALTRPKHDELSFLHSYIVRDQTSHLDLTWPAGSRPLSYLETRTVLLQGRPTVDFVEMVEERLCRQGEWRKRAVTLFPGKRALDLVASRYAGTSRMPDTLLVCRYGPDKTEVEYKHQMSQWEILLYRVKKL